MALEPEQTIACSALDEPRMGSPFREKKSHQYATGPPSSCLFDGTLPRLAYLFLGSLDPVDACCKREGSAAHAGRLTPRSQEVPLHRPDYLSCANYDVRGGHTMEIMLVQCCAYPVSLAQRL